MLMAKRPFWNTRNVMIIILFAALIATIWLVVWAEGRQPNSLMVYVPAVQTGEDVIKSEDGDIDPYKGWGTCADVSDGISFRYPMDWEQPNILENYCSTVPLPGSVFGLASPKSAEDTYLFRVQLLGGIDPADLAMTDSTQGQKIIDVLPLDVPGAKKQLFIVAFADLQNGADVTAMAVTDQKYSVGQVVEYVARPINQTDGKAWQLMVNLAEAPSQQNMVQHPLSDYMNHPYYSTVLQIFKSIRVLQ